MQEVKALIVDFHTHTFPDKIAQRSIFHLSNIGHILPHRVGTLDGLKESMAVCGIDYSVVLPVATSPKQEHTINDVSAALNGKDHLFFAGAIHPDCEDVPGTLDFIKQSGLFGIKLHPDYQGVYFNDPRYIRIMAEAASRGLYILTHAGMDIAYRNDIHCTPDMILRVLHELEGLIDDKLILAHLGGFALEDEVLQKLCGKPVWMDTAAVIHMRPAKCRAIIEKHGPEKVLFGSDSPWENQRDFAERLIGFGFSDDDTQRMLWQNAQTILGTNTL